MAIMGIVKLVTMGMVSMPPEEKTETAEIEGKKSIQSSFVLSLLLATYSILATLACPPRHL